MTRRPTANRTTIANLGIVLLVFLAVANCPESPADEPSTSTEASAASGATTNPSATKPSEAAQADAAQSDAAQSDAADGEFRPLLQNWESASFGGDGAIEFTSIKKSGDAKHDDQLIEFAPGDPLTGIRWTGPLPRENYELRLQARRVEGFDFFVAVTFPVGEEHCSFVLGGWGGGILGISSINGDDAANNETTQYKDFKNGQWYPIRIRVDEKAIVCWIGDEEWVNVERGRNSFDIRIEMDPCLPLGLANFQCTSEIKSVQIRKLKP